MANAPYHESPQYAAHLLRVGATIIRKRDGKSVYFNPGDSTADFVKSIGHCLTFPEMWEGENNKVFNQWCGQFFN